MFSVTVSNNNHSSLSQIASHIVCLIIYVPSHFSHVQLFATPWTAACQASLSIANSQSLPKLTSSESVMPSNQLILCHPLLLLPSIFPSIRVFSNESALHIFTLDHYIYYCGQESLRRDRVAIIVNKSLKCSTWMQSQKQQNDPCSFLRQTIQNHGDPSLCPDQ